MINARQGRSPSVGAAGGPAWCLLSGPWDPLFWQSGLSWAILSHPVMGLFLFSALSAEWIKFSITLKLETDIPAPFCSFIVSFSSGKTAVTVKTWSSYWKTPVSLLQMSVSNLRSNHRVSKLPAFSLFTTKHAIPISFLIKQITFSCTIKRHKRY